MLTKKKKKGRNVERAYWRASNRTTFVLLSERRFSGKTLRSQSCCRHRENRTHIKYIL